MINFIYSVYIIIHNIIGVYCHNTFILPTLIAVIPDIITVI